MALSEKFLSEIKLRNDIESVISEHVKLKNRGKSLVGLCPFHSEKTASFTVFPDTQSYYCFGCGAGGDVITFVRMIENLDYLDAVRVLADRAGLEMPEKIEYEKKGASRERILEMNKAAGRFFFDCLNSPEGEQARQYVEKRRLSEKTVRKYGLGFAPDSWDALLKHLTSRGFRETEIRDAGLCVRGKKGGMYDYFRNRLMIPIFDVRGNLIAFGGRVMDDSAPKYLNSPDTALFKKSSNLYNLNNAKTSSAGRLILCEGYLDVLSVAAAGFTEAVATLGTAITEEHARILARYSGEGGVVIAYDSDAAGQKATQKAIGYLEKVGVKVRIIKMTGAKDPDEFIKTFGAERFRQLIDASGNQIEFKLANAAAKYDVASDSGKMSYLREAIDVLSRIPSATTRDIYAGKLSRELEVEKHSILSEIEGARRKYAKNQKRLELKADEAGIAASRDRVNPEKKYKLKAAKAEEGLISILFFYPELLPFIGERVQPQDFVTEFNRRLYVAIAEIVERGGVPDTAVLGADFSREEMSRLAEILNLRTVLSGMDEIKKAVGDYCDSIMSEKAGSIKENASQLETGQIREYIESLAKKKGKEED